MVATKIHPEKKWELSIEIVLLSIVAFMVIFKIASSIKEFLKYENITAIVVSKTYFGLEKDKCAPTKPLNGVCVGLTYTYKTNVLRNGYVQFDEDTHKIGDKISISVEKKNPDNISQSKKNINVFYIIYLISVSLLLTALVHFKLRNIGLGYYKWTK